MRADRQTDQQTYRYANRNTSPTDRGRRNDEKGSHRREETVDVSLARKLLSVFDDVWTSCKPSTMFGPRVIGRLPVFQAPVAAEATHVIGRTFKIHCFYNFTDVIKLHCTGGAKNRATESENGATVLRLNVGRHLQESDWLKNVYTAVYEFCNVA